jgi:hypothetical protein
MGVPSLGFQFLRQVLWNAENQNLHEQASTKYQHLGRHEIVACVWDQDFLAQRRKGAKGRKKVSPKCLFLKLCGFAALRENLFWQLVDSANNPFTHQRSSKVKQ